MSAQLVGSPQPAPRRIGIYLSAPYIAVNGASKSDYADSEALNPIARRSALVLRLVGR